MTMIKKLRLYFDTEFTELSKKGELISLAFISENDEIFYAEFDDFSIETCNEWVMENVISNLLFKDRETFIKCSGDVCYMKDASGRIADALCNWFSELGDVEIYADCLSFDWVFFCNLFGTAFNIPKEIFYIPFDLAGFLKYRGIDPDIDRENFVEKYKGDAFIKKIRLKAAGLHNALYDAFLVKAVFEIIETEITGVVI